MDEALAIAEKIASMSEPGGGWRPRRAINRAFEMPPLSGRASNLETHLFHSTFALEDRAEGMAAFIEKRKPVNRNRVMTSSRGMRCSPAALPEG